MQSIYVVDYLVMPLIPGDDAEIQLHSYTDRYLNIMTTAAPCNCGKNTKHGLVFSDKLQWHYLASSIFVKTSTYLHLFDFKSN